MDSHFDVVKTMLEHIVGDFQALPTHTRDGN